MLVVLIGGQVQWENTYVASLWSKGKFPGYKSGSRVGKDLLSDTWGGDRCKEEETALG